MNKPVMPSELIERETLASWVSRYAAEFWVDAASLCRDKGASFSGIISNSNEAVARLSDHGLDALEAFRLWSPKTVGSRTQLFREHLFPTRVLRSPIMRGCPRCLREHANDGLNQMAMQGHWLVPHVSMCLRHGTPLVPLWRASKATTRFDSAPRLAELAPKILSGELDVAPRKSFDFDLWIEDRLAGNETQEAWLDQHSLHAACNLCRYLGAARLRLEDIPLSRTTPADRPILYEMGFQVARKGDDAILQTLEDLQRKPGSPQDGAKAIFPLLYERLAYDHLNDPDYAPFQAILRKHMETTWPLGPGDDLLGQPIETRRLHSVRTAAQNYGIDQRRLRKALAAKQIVPTGEKGLPDAWEVFDAEAAASVLNELTQLVDAKEMAATINATRSQFDLLVADGVLNADLETTRIKAVWNPSHGQKFLDSVLVGAQQLRQAQHGWEHISKSAQRLKTGPGEIIKAIQDGRVTRVGNRMGSEGYAAIHVYYDDVAAILRPDPLDAKNVEVFAKSVGINQPSNLTRLINDGHVQTTTMQNPITKAQQLYFTPDDEIAFHARFLTPKTLAKMFGQSWQKLTSQLRAASVKPFSPEGQCYGNVYLRSDAERVLS